MTCLVDSVTYRLVREVAGYCQIGMNAFASCRAVVLAGRTDCQFLMPLLLPLTDRGLGSVEQSLKTDHSFVSMPLVVFSNSYFESRHIVHILLKRESGVVKEIEYFDSRGAPATTYPSVMALMSRLKKADTVYRENKKVLQWFCDWFNCGPYVLYYLEQRLGKGIPMERLSSPRMGILAYRSFLSRRLAQQYRSALPIPKDWQLVEEGECEAAEP